MTTSQKSMVAEEIAKMKQGARTDLASKEAKSPDASQQEAADLMKVSRSNVQRARKVKERGAPELADAVVAGELTVTSAANITVLPKEEQRALLREGKEAIRDKLKELRSPPESEARRIFEHGGRAAKEVRSGIVLVKNIDADASTTRGRGGAPRHDDAHERVRELTEQGFTTLDIVQRTGLKESFVRHSRAQAKGPKRILAGLIDDAESFGESLERRANEIDARWRAQPRSDRDALIAALRLCRSAATKIINRLNKEATNKEELDETHQAEAV